MNTASILNLRESQEKLKTENTASFELIKKGQEELNLMMATFIKQNCESRVDGNSPGEISSGKQFYANSNFSEINTGENISVNVAEKEIEQFNYENEADI